MWEKKLILFLFLFTILIFFSPKLVQAIHLCRWQGYANISGTLINTTHYITVYNGTKTYNATIFSDGMYTADVQADSSDVIISFKICGVDADQGGQAWSCPASDFNTLNLSITALANGVSCSYSCACSGGYCCSGATEYTSGEGTGTCQSSACSAAEEAAPSVGAVTAGVAAVTVTVEESKTFASISADTTAFFNVTKSDDLKIQEINITVIDEVVDVKITIKEGSLPSGAPLPVSEDIGLVYKYLEITKTNIDDANISMVKMKFKVEKTWISNNNIDSNLVALQRYANGRWTKLTTMKLSEDSKYVYYVVETSALSTFAVTGEKVIAKKVCPYECCVGEADYRDKACASGFECENRTCKPIPLCIEDWSCTEWSECIEGIQTRTCTDLNDCGTEEDKPVESQTCEVAPLGIVPIITTGILVMVIVVLVIGLIVYLLRSKIFPSSSKKIFPVQTI